MGREEGKGSGWGAHAYLWRIHFDIWQNQYNIVKLKNKIKFKKNKKQNKTKTPQMDILNMKEYVGYSMHQLSGRGKKMTQW